MFARYVLPFIIFSSVYILFVANVGSLASLFFLCYVRFMLAHITLATVYISNIYSIFLDSKKSED